MGIIFWCAGIFSLRVFSWDICEGLKDEHFFYFRNPRDVLIFWGVCFKNVCKVFTAENFWDFFFKCFFEILFFSTIFTTNFVNGMVATQNPGGVLVKNGRPFSAWDRYRNFLKLAFYRDSASWGMFYFVFSVPNKHNPTLPPQKK